jgi:cardiolipin synthase
MEFFSFFDDPTGRDMIARLSQKAKEGVQVNLLVDHLGSVMKGGLLDDMREAGIRVKPFTNGSDYPLLNANSTTDHRKILLVDGKVGMTGGMNIGTPYQNHWHDFMVKIEGPTLGDLYKTFERNWELSDGDRMRDIVPDLAPKGAHAAQVAVTTPRKDEIRRTFLAAFDNAQDKILINSPYFIDEEMVEALKRASGRGVKVTAMIPSIGDNPIVDQMNRSVINEMLDAKIDVRVYDTKNPDFKAHDHAIDNFNHGKIATIDGQLSIVGTANMDTRSMLKNQEINLNVDSKAFAKEIEERVFKHDFATKARPAVKREFTAAERLLNKGLNSLRRFF